MTKTVIMSRSAKALASVIALISLLLPAADIKAGAQPPSDFSVRAVIPDNQADIRQSYFDLRMNPGDVQTVQIVIHNSRREELVARVGLNAASTGRNGLIDYTKPDIRDEGVKLSITDVAALQTQTITVPALGSAEVGINIQLPEEAYNGVLLGGIVVTADDMEDDTQLAEGVALKNTITYVIGLKITENDSEIAPDFALTAIMPGLVNYRTAVAVTLYNKAPRIVKNMEVKAQVYRSETDTLLHELDLREAEMAPLSKGDFVIDWGGKALQAGVYRLRMTAKYEDRIWEWDEEFVIAEEAKDINQEAVGLEKDYTPLYLWTGLLILIIVVFIVFWRGRRNKKIRDND